MAKVVAILAPWNSPVYLKRMWCRFEMFKAMTTHPEIELEIIMPPREMTEFQQSLHTGEGLGEMWAAISNMQTEFAEASEPDVKDLILEPIGKGFMLLDIIINQKV